MQYVYFARQFYGRLIKIGRAANPKARSSDWGPIQILALEGPLENARERELELHARFAHLRVNWSEWFEPDADLRAHIASLPRLGDNVKVERPLLGRYAASTQYDRAARKRTRRFQRQRGCSVYIPAEELAKTGFDVEGPPPFYRVWAAARGRVVIQLYRDQ